MSKQKKSIKVSVTFITLVAGVTPFSTFTDIHQWLYVQHRKRWRKCLHCSGKLMHLSDNSKLALSYRFQTWTNVDLPQSACKDGSQAVAEANGGARKNIFICQSCAMLLVYSKWIQAVSKGGGGVSLQETCGPNMAKLAPDLATPPGTTGVKFNGGVQHLDTFPLSTIEPLYSEANGTKKKDLLRARYLLQQCSAACAVLWLRFYPALAAVVQGQ